MGAPQGDYAALAEFWDCFFGDRGAEIECWANLAARFGRRVLAPMAATGELAHGVAAQGFDVVAVDVAPEMLEEGRRRHPETGSFRWARGELTTLDLDERGFDFAFLASGDFHHFAEADAQRAALASLAEHLRPGGALGLELFAPAPESWSTPRRTFEPLRAPDPPGTRVWKEGASRFDRATGTLEIDQELHVRRHGRDEVEVRPHRLRLALHQREALSGLLEDAGYRVLDEYGSYALEPYGPGAATWIVVARSLGGASRARPLA